MIYIDTSSFLKLFIKEDYSIETGEYTFQQKEIIVTTLTILEARSNMRALQMGGKLRKSKAARSKKTM